MEIMMASLAPAILKQYNVALKRWLCFCRERKISVFKAKPEEVLSFLSHIFKEGASYGTLNSYRSAISLISDESLGHNETISRFFKGVYRLRPSRPRYNFTWDVSEVLRFIETLFPLEKLSLQDLTEKVVTLIALSTAHRVQTIASIKISNIVPTMEGLLIKIPDTMKTSKAGSYQPLLCLPYFNDKPQLCVAGTILHYIERTKTVRGKVEELLLSTRKPHKSVTTQTVSRWIKLVLSKSGIDVSVFSAHSTRHAATSAALVRGLDLEAIRKSAGWSANSKTFANFYNRPILQESNIFAKTVFQK